MKTLYLTTKKQLETIDEMLREKTLMDLLELKEELKLRELSNLEAERDDLAKEIDSMEYLGNEYDIEVYGIILDELDMEIKNRRVEKMLKIKKYKNYDRVRVVELKELLSKEELNLYKEELSLDAPYDVMEREGVIFMREGVIGGRGQFRYTYLYPIAYIGSIEKMFAVYEELLRSKSMQWYGFMGEDYGFLEVKHNGKVILNMEKGKIR